MCPSASGCKLCKVDYMFDSSEEEMVLQCSLCEEGLQLIRGECVSASVEQFACPADDASLSGCAASTCYNTIIGDSGIACLSCTDDTYYFDAATGLCKLPEITHSCTAYQLGDTCVDACPVNTLSSP